MVDSPLPVRPSLTIDAAIQRARDVLDQALDVLSGAGRTPLSTPVTREALAAALLRGRRQRAGLIRNVDFGEPAWDILLELYVARAGHTPISVSSLCIASGVPTTTALRWIARLEQTRHIERTPDPRDRRRYFLRITSTAYRDVDRWLDAMVAMLG